MAARHAVATLGLVILLLVGPLECNPSRPYAAPLTPPKFNAASFPEYFPNSNSGIVDFVGGVALTNWTFNLGHDVGGPYVYVTCGAGGPGGKKAPCLLITGLTPEVFGDGQSGDYNAEHIRPYIREGFVVVSNPLSQPHFHGPDPQGAARAIDYKDSQAGFNDAERALEFALARLPMIDPKRIYTVGYGSSGTVALLVAENDRRISGCVAYAPCTDVRQRLAGNGLLPKLEAQIPSYGDFIDQTSPISGVQRLRCPLFLFHAKDDDNVPIAESVRFVEEVKKSNPNVTFIQAEQGGHHDGMIKDGIPKAIEWLKALPAN